MKTSFRQFIAGLIILSLTLLPPPVSAVFGVGDIVFDPSNYAENVMTAARALKSNLNEAMALANQARSLANEAMGLYNQARNLVRLPVDYWNRVMANYEQLKALAEGNAGIGEYLQRVDAQFNALYPGDQVIESYGQAYKNWTDNALKTAQSVIQTANEQRKYFESTSDQTKETVLQGSQAQGVVQAVQAQVALSGQMVGELQKVQQLQERHAALMAAYVSGQVQEKATQHEELKKWLDESKKYKSIM